MDLWSRFVCTEPSLCIPCSMVTWTRFRRLASSPDATTMINALLDQRSWALFDVDLQGRILASHDDAGNMQPVERSLAAAPVDRSAVRCSGRYVRAPAR